MTRVLVLVSADRHFLKLTLERPRIMTARAFLDAFRDAPAD